MHPANGGAGKFLFKFPEGLKGHDFAVVDQVEFPVIAHALDVEQLIQVDFFDLIG